MKWRLGIDVGGTFTDLYLVDERARQQHTLKVQSTPEDPSRAIVTGVTTLLQRHSVCPGDVSYLAHGTTVATNTILQRVGARVGMVTTAGFRDLLEIGRQKRPSVYDLFADKPPVLVPRRLRREIAERMAYDGSVIKRLDPRSVRRELRELLSSGIDTVAVCLLHSYANPEHEQHVRGLLRELAPDLYVSVSHELTSEFREYERFLTTVLNAYVGPCLAEYLSHLRCGLAELGMEVAPHIIQSNGGLMSIRAAIETPVRTVLSGPSAGVVGAAWVARQARLSNVITLDMGGTSTDVSLLKRAEATMQPGLSVAGYPIRVPSIAIHTIGAGGGSIAWTDSASGFHVGPQSAGAVPGPAAYGLGGERPTVTDANVLLGRLNPRALLDGGMPIYRDRAEQAVQSVAQPLGLSTERAAAGILQIVVSAMVRAVRVISVEKGEDPRDFTLMPFGGAGALHACAVARQLGITTVLVPQSPGLLCSLGALLAVPTMEYSRTRVLGTNRTAEISRTFSALKAQARRWLVQEHVPVKVRRLQCSVDMRYVGQNHELMVPLPSPRIDRKSLSEAVELFHRKHRKQFGYDSPQDTVQTVTCRVVATGVATHVKAPRGTRKNKFVPREKRSVYFETDSSWHDCPVFRRADLSSRTRIDGPAIVEQLDATTVVYPGDVVSIDTRGNMVIALMPVATETPRT